MMCKPLVTVIIPVFNCEKYIRDSVDSALNQTYSNIEVIAVDDGSSDGSHHILQTYGDRISIISQKNLGAAVARNAGIAASTGKYVAFLDSDDFWFPEKIEAQVKYLEDHPEVKMVFCGWLEWPYSRNKGSPQPRRVAQYDLQAIQQELSGDLYKELLLECVVHTSTVVMNIELTHDIGGFDPEFRKGQDYDYWLRASRKTLIHKLSATLSLYRIHEESITSNPGSINYEYFAVKNALDKWGLSGFTGQKANRREVYKHLSNTWLNFGSAFLEIGQAKHAKSAFIKAIQYRPTHLRLWALLGFSFYKSIIP